MICTSSNRIMTTPDLESPLVVNQAHAVNLRTARRHSSSSVATVVSTEPHPMLRKKERVALVLGYCGLGLTLAMIVRVSSLAASAASAFMAVLWLGFIMALSFLEWWAKFRSPFVPRHLALDVGRTVAKAKHSAELGLVLGLWLVHALGSAHFDIDDTFLMLVTLKMLFAIQHRLLWPRLELRAEFALYDALKNESSTVFMTEPQWNEIDRIAQLVKHVDEPSQSFQWAYFAVEGIKKKDRIALVLVYSGVGVTLALIVRVSSLAAAAASAFIAVLWLGFVLALSFLESWVKFRAPFVAEHLALDVGRTVAKAKHAAELGLVLGLWLVHVVGSAHFRLDATFITLASLKMLFAIQHRVLWPRLELRAEFALYDSLKNESPTESRTEAQWNEVDRITQLVKQVAEPPKSYEWAYFAVEAIKVVLLLCLSFHFLAAQSPFVALLWLGFILAISFMEAWVKFRAPFVPRHLLLDVGRTVFAVKHAAEMGLLLGLASVHIFGSPHFATDSSLALLITLKVMFALQHRLTASRLERRAEFALYDALKHESVDSMTTEQHDEYERIQKQVAATTQPSAAFHGAYIGAEVVKVVLLMVLIFRCLKRMPDAE
ncbi:TPA: LOW QUALITY PROTEIN: hypothetical protein N0F65_011737 [Lagenidium giganteum]|uniref:Uncharacterized protein n=1 Tax=Lagenidium giganteum TaxID=4803 RepID=A0AAV2YJA6_9STRA|nr:TPA: LOW QUALITY PROTEIN: hypothetical protein N0F65_011737 [Lagenidium giganteum]